MRTGELSGVHIILGSIIWLVNTRAAQGLSSYTRYITDFPIKMSDEELEIHAPSRRKGAPDSYLRSSLLATLLFCPIGIFALYQSLRVIRLYTSGQEEASRQASEKASANSSRAFLASLIIVSIGMILVLVGLTLLICFAIDWGNR